MENMVRIKSISIQGFKNVRNGYLSFDNSKRNYAVSILGLYGQNGSGKTALIDVLELLKLALSGRVIPAYFANCVNVNSSFAAVKYEFTIQNAKNNSSYNVFYELNLKRDIKEPDHNSEDPETTEDYTENYKATIYNEVLSYSYENEKGDKVRLSPVIDTRTKDDVPFAPSTKYKVLVGKDKETATNLIVAKQMAKVTSRSFVFSRDLINKIRQNCQEDHHLYVINRLVWFGNTGLLTVSTANTGLISMNTLPLSFRYPENGKVSIGVLPLSLDDASWIPAQALDILKKVIDNMNIVLRQLVPGLTIGIYELGNQLSQKGTPRYKIQFTSKKNDKEIPLRYESDGIKKIVSILQLLIVVYNNPSITVAIDELDSGVFEYLLGELLRIISEKGKGQLIFTSHNLRPLETLDKGFIAFTTTNPEKRYIRMSNVKTSNNLRDFYYRDIILGEQSEPVYEATNNYEIALAFREAGASYVS